MLVLPSEDCGLVTWMLPIGWSRARNSTDVRTERYASAAGDRGCVMATSGVVFRFFQSPRAGTMPSTLRPVAASRSSFVFTESSRYSRRKARATARMSPTTMPARRLRIGSLLIGSVGTSAAESTFAPGCEAMAMAARRSSSWAT